MFGDDSSQAVLGQAMRAVKDGHKRPTMEDPDENPKKERPFEGGSTLKVASYNKEKGFHDYDTGIPIGEGTAQFLAGAGKRFSDVGDRVRQLTGQEGAQEDIDFARVRDQDLMEQTPAMLGYMIPDVVATAPLSGMAALKVPFRKAPVNVNLSGYKSTAGIGAAQGSATPTTSEEGLGVEAANVGLGSVAAMGGKFVGDRIGNTVGKSVNAFKGNWKNPEHRRLYDLAKENDVPVTIGDIDPTSGWRRTEDMLQSAPSGRRADMQRQQDAMRGVVDDLRGQFATPNPGAEGATISEGVKNEYLNAKTAAGTKFKTVGNMAKSDPNVTKIKPMETYQAAQDAEAAYPKLFGEFQHDPFMRKVLGLDRDTGPQPGLIINPKNMQPFKYDQELSFEDAQFLRKRLGAWWEKLNTGHRNGTLPEGLDAMSVNHAGKIFGAFDRDLDTWGTAPQNSAINDAWKDARGFFNDNVMPYRDPGRLASKTPLVKKMALLDEDRRGVDPATVVDKIFPSRETSIAGDIADMTSPEGKLAMKSALINKMTDDAVSPDIDGLGNSVLLKHTTKHGHSGEAVFDAAEQARIQQVRDLAKMTGRSGDIGGNGMGVIPYLMGGSAGAGALGYYGPRLMDKDGESLTMAERTLLTLGVAPLAAILAARGARGYSSSNIGKGMHFLNPDMEGALGKMQKFGSNIPRGAAQPTEDEYVRYPLGHRQ
jgi:hypothetical protein